MDRKLAGAAHSVLGRVLLQENKFPAGAAELKTATTLLQDSPEDLAGALYYLGFAYAKMERAADAIHALTQASNIQSPYQQPAQELLGKIKAARTRR
jgi:tetratricopeptide (TPR) repeat protein